MLLDNTAGSLPAFTSDTTYSFYRHSLASPRSDHLHHPISGPGPSSTEHQERRNAIDRAAKRALVGKRPAGTGGGREADDLSEEERNLEEDKASHLDDIADGRTE